MYRCTQPAQSQPNSIYFIFFGDYTDISWVWTASSTRSGPIRITSNTSIGSTDLSLYPRWSIRRTSWKAPETSKLPARRQNQERATPRWPFSHPAHLLENPWHIAQTPTGFAEFVRNGLPMLHARSCFRLFQVLRRFALLASNFTQPRGAGMLAALCCWSFLYQTVLLVMHSPHRQGGYPSRTAPVQYG